MIGPEVSEQMQEWRSKTADEAFDEINKIPFFAKDTSAIESTPEFEAIKALQEESEPYELAKDEHEDGNTLFKNGKIRNAQECYSKALDHIATGLMKCDKPNEKGLQTQARLEAFRDLQEILWLNRAACNLKLENFRAAITDCKSILERNKKSTKAYFRTAQALASLRKWAESLEVLRIAEENCDCSEISEFKKLKLSAQQGLNQAALKEQKIVAEQTEFAKASRILEVEMKRRGYRSIQGEEKVDLQDAILELENYENPQNSPILITTVFLYPLCYQSDLILKFPDTCCIYDQLETVLEHYPPWDEGREYSTNNVEVFMIDSKSAVLRVDTLKPLGTILSQNSIFIKDKVLTIFVVPKVKANDWLRDQQKGALN